MGNSRSKGRGRLGFLFWTAFILFLAVIYLANREDITQVLESTQFVEIVSTKIRGEDPTLVVERRDREPVPSSEEQAGDGSMDAQEDQDSNPSRIAEDGPSQESQPTEEEIPDTVGETEELGESEETETVETVTALELPPRQEEESESGLRRKRESKLYYIRVTEDGSIYPQAVTRTVHYTDSPMTETLKTLVSGPTADELNMGLLNLIPEGTLLRSAWVKDGVAYLNFNEEFRFNPMGVEGFMAQLQQVVFSATEFSTIEEVQILIEGERVEYLGGEGIYIGEPLGRGDFSS
ncbi:MAG: GerMN domain-containing protein [Spirochaetaceae bacterium]